MTYYTVGEQLQQPFRGPARNTWDLDEGRVSQVEQPIAPYELEFRSEGRVGSFLADVAGRGSVSTFSHTASDVDHTLGEQTIQLLSDMKVGVVGLGGSQLVRADLNFAFGGVGERLADVASQTYRVPRLFDSTRQAKAVAATELLSRWLEESDPSEVEEWGQFKTALNEDRPSHRKLFP